MLRTRLWMGSLLVGLASLLLLEERWGTPWYPLFGVVYLAASVLATRELWGLLPIAVRPRRPLLFACIVAMALGNWLVAWQRHDPQFAWLDVWHVLGGLWLTTIVSAFLVEMRGFTGPTQQTQRLAMTAFVLAYVGILPSFLAQLRWLPHSTAAIALAVFVPKCNDIGAYFTGKFLTGKLLGRHPMTPLLSPKKTWQGLCGGMLASVLVATGLNQWFGHVLGPWYIATGFGLVVGTAGVLGDLAESLLKRDLQIKDASQAVPGFGGVLDVVDSLLFAAPVVYLWFRIAC